jgi:uncharacterized protein YbjT (DUF2867 family)
MQSSDEIIVTGASGYIGGRLVPLLVERGYKVRVLARKPAILKKKEWQGVEVFQGDALEPESLLKALKGVTTCYYMIHSMTSYGHTFAEKDLSCAENFARMAEKAGVDRIIYLGGLGSKESQSSKHLRSRHEVGDVLRAGKVSVTELRAAIVVGAGSASFEIIRDLSRQLPVMICPRWVSSKCEPISIAQLLEYLVGCLKEPKTRGQVYDVGGGEVLTYADMLRQCAELMGRSTKILTVPVLTPRLSSYWLNLVTSVPFSLARPLVEGLRSDVICSDFRIRELISVPRVSYKEAVRLALENEQNRGLLTRWSDANNDYNVSQIDETAVPLQDERSLTVHASKEKIFSVIENLGGQRGWLHANWLWRLRAGLDSLLGGVGMRRGRPQPQGLFVGDPVDFWRVEEMVRPNLLVLRAEMKLPGTARLIFLIDDEGQAARTTIQARFWPSGVLGRLYWFSLVPLHKYIFEGMLKALKKEAEV